MKIFRLILLVMATALFMINFWMIDYQDLWSRGSLLAYARILAASLLIVFLVRMVRRDGMKRKREDKRLK